MKTRLIILTTLISCTCVAQGDERTKDNFGYSVRGKAMAGPVSPEDDMAITYTIGNEFLYRRHSIGADYTYFRFSHQRDDFNDVPQYNNYVRRRYILVDYKYVLIQKEDKDFYFNMYHKTGRYNSWFELQKDAYISPVNPETINGTFKDIGGGFGTKFYFGRFGVDVSANYAHRFEYRDITTQITTTQTELSTTYDEKDLFYIRINLFYEFGKRRTKYLE
jgi:hypothetical protein